MLNWLKVWWLQLRYGLESGADVSRALSGAVGGAKIRRIEWKDAKAVSGHYGKTVIEARLNALRFWVRKHGQPKEIILGNDKSAFAFVNIDKSGVSHTFSFGQARYGMGHEPASGHKPVTIIEVENGAVPCDTRCDNSLNKVACNSCKPNNH